MVSEFLTWWGRQLLSLWPAREQAWRGDAVLASLRDSDKQVEVSVRRRGRTGELGKFKLNEAGRAALQAALGPRRPPAELQLGPGQLLERPIVLPLAAERDPERVLRYEMDRLTPFAADELYWSWSVERRDRVQGQLHLRLAMVVRAQADAALAMLRGAGLRPVAIVGASSGRIALDAARPGRWQRWGTRLLLAACALLAVAAGSLPFLQQGRASRRIERQIASLRPAVDRAEAMRREQATAAQGVDVLAKAQALFGDPLAILATLTDILPDDTVLTDLALSKRVLTLSGQSAAAARLIPALASDPDLRDPVFTAPVTRSDALHADIFTIRAVAAAPAPAR